MLTFPCAYNLKKEVRHWMISKVTLQRMTKLVTALDNQIDYHVGSKLLRLLCISHRLDPRDTVTMKYEQATASETEYAFSTGRLDVLFSWSNYLHLMLSML